MPIYISTYQHIYVKYICVYIHVCICMIFIHLFEGQRFTPQMSAASWRWARSCPGAEDAVGSCGRGSRLPHHRCRPGWNLGWSQGLGLGTLTWEVGVFKCKTKLLSLSMTSHILKNIFYLAGTMVIQLSLWLQWPHPIWMLVQGMAAPLLMQLPDNGLGRQWKSAKFLCPYIHVGDSKSLWLWTGQCGIEPRWDICLYPSLSEILSSNKKNTINI